METTQGRRRSGGGAGILGSTLPGFAVVNRDSKPTSSKPQKVGLKHVFLYKELFENLVIGNLQCVLVFSNWEQLNCIYMCVFVKHDCLLCS